MILPSRRELSGSIIDKVYEDCLIENRIRIGDAEAVSLSLDCSKIRETSVYGAS